MKKRELEKIIDEAFERHHESEAEAKLTPTLFREMVEQAVSESTGEPLDLGTEADDEVAVCDSAIGCEDFGTPNLDESLQEQISGQASERNLVAAINGVVEANGGEPVALTIGSLGEHLVVGAKQMGGGKPEPKADISILLASGEALGISMKKENFSFLENRMDERKFRAKLAEVGLEQEASDILVADMKEKLAEVTKEQAAVIEEEKRRFLAIVQSADPSYVFASPLIKDSPAHQALAASDTFGRGGVLKNSFKIRNIYLHLSDVLGDAYRSFLKLVVSGAATNPARAEGVLIADVPPGISDIRELQGILDKTKSIDEVVEKYINDPRVNIKFRLRPITKVRTTYSKSNRTHYKVGERMYDDPELGISWTVFAVR